MSMTVPSAAALLFSGGWAPSPFGTVSRSAMKCSVSYVKIRREKMELEIEAANTTHLKSPITVM